MKRHAVAWAQVARDDLEQIIDFIARDSVLNALKVLDRIEAFAHSLVTMPERGRIVLELRLQGIVRYREIILKPWRLLSRIDGAEVRVVSVLDGRRDLETLLLERFALRH